MKLAFLVPSIGLLACGVGTPSVLGESELSVNPHRDRRLELRLGETGDVGGERSMCRMLPSSTTVTINGKPASFLERESGGCGYREIFSLLAKNSTVWRCNCLPAVIELPPGDVELTICGDDCATVAWPAPPPLPTPTLAAPVVDHKYTLQFTPALPADELDRVINIVLEGGHELPTRPQWGTGTATVQSRPDFEGGIEVRASRFDTISPTRCEGFGSCSPRYPLSQQRVVLRP